MLSRSRPDTRVILLLIIALFLALVAVWWALRAGRVGNATASTPLPGATTPAPPPVAPAGPLPSP